MTAAFLDSWLGFLAHNFSSHVWTPHANVAYRALIDIFGGTDDRIGGLLTALLFSWRSCSLGAFFSEFSLSRCQRHFYVLQLVQTRLNLSLEPLCDLVDHFAVFLQILLPLEDSLEFLEPEGEYIDDLFDLKLLQLSA